MMRQRTTRLFIKSLVICSATLTPSTVQLPCLDSHSTIPSTPRDHATISPTFVAHCIYRAGKIDAESRKRRHCHPCARATLSADNHHDSGPGPKPTGSGTCTTRDLEYMCFPAMNVSFSGCHDRLRCVTMLLIPCCICEGIRRRACLSMFLVELQWEVL